MENDGLMEQEAEQENIENKLQDECAEETVETQEEEVTEEASAAAEQCGTTYKERNYLRYCGGKRTAQLDLSGTKAFLQGIGFDGGELKQAREGRNRSDAATFAEKNQKNDIYCSYCGAAISGVEFYRLPGEKLRCASCTATLVKTKTEMEVLCGRVRAHMDSFFGASIEVPVDIEVLDECKLKRRLGIRLGTQDDRSKLILGVAVNKKNRYKIYLQNGAPRISVAATFAHELTHIWQYTHWDNREGFKVCPESNRLLVYEGMAKWAEIQYLYLIGEINTAKREELITRKRKDEYGRGFCLYDEYYPLVRETMHCEETPFTPERYPFA